MTETLPTAWWIEDPNQAPAYKFTAGGSFVLDTSPNPEPIWGAGEDVLLADGEALVIAGSQGLGKTTLAQQLALGRCGFPEYQSLLGYPIRPGNGRTLYLAMDRPKQAARSMRRMIGEAWREELDARLVVWQGPPPGDLAKHPTILTALCQEAGADTVIVDSLKDAAIGLSDDEVGAGYQRARQTATAAGVQVIELHHNRKALSGAKRVAPTIDDVYGSTWISTGAGSVIILSGDPGDPIVGFHHAKQPAAVVGPFKVAHDHQVGRTTIWHSTDLVRLATAAPHGITSLEAARAVEECDKPTPAQRQKALRRLEKLHSEGLLYKVEADKSTQTPTRFYATARSIP